MSCSSPGGQTEQILLQCRRIKSWLTSGALLSQEPFEAALVQEWWRLGHAQIFAGATAFLGGGEKSNGKKMAIFSNSPNRAGPLPCNRCLLYNMSR